MSKSFPKSLSLFGLRKLGYSELQERPEKSHRGIYQGVAKCRGSWVVSRGRGSWVWVNVVGKKVVQKQIEIRQKVVKFIKRKSPINFPFLRSAKQISESFSTNGHS